MAVALYIYKYGQKLDSQRFAYVPDSCPVTTVRNDHGEELLTKIVMWVKRWRHCGPCGMQTCREIGADYDIPFVRFHE